MVPSHSLSKIFLKISPLTKICCLLDDKAREGPARPALPSTQLPSVQWQVLAFDLSITVCFLLAARNPNCARQRGHRTIVQGGEA